MHGKESATDRRFVRLLIVSGIWLSGVYVTHAVWGADPNPTPSTATEPPASQTPAPPSPSTAPMQGGMKEGKHKMQEACGADIKQFCPNIEHGGGRIVRCLEQHQKEVSVACNQLLEKHESRKGKGN